MTLTPPTWGLSSPSHAFTPPPRRVQGDLRASSLTGARLPLTPCSPQKKCILILFFNTNAFSGPLPILSTTCAEFEVSVFRSGGTAAALASVWSCRRHLLRVQVHTHSFALVFVDDVIQSKLCKGVVWHFWKL